MNNLNINSKIILNNGLPIPVIGLGVFKMADGPEVENAVKWALEAGYRMIDTAMIYENEAGVGKAIKESGIPREEIFVTTKLWNADQGYETALSAIDASLERLGLQYVDLYLVHWPTASADRGKFTSINKREETWKAMEEIYASGKAKAIGVSNYTMTHLEEMKNYMKVPPSVNQVEFHPFLYQRELMEYCKREGIALEAYRSLTAGQRMTDSVIEEIAKTHAKSDAQVLLRWAVQHGIIIIPKSTKKERIEENLNIFDFELSPGEMNEIDALNENLRLSPDPSLLT